MMTRLRASLLGVDFATLSAEERRIRLKYVVLMGFFVALMIFASVSGYVLGLHSGSAIRITEDHARNFGGIIATVIPIFIVALYVDSSPKWGAYDHKKVLAHGKPDASRSEDDEKDFISPFHLLYCLFGETLAVSSVLTPTTFQVRLATYSLAFLLFLFGFRLNVGALKRSGTDSSKFSSYVGAITFLLFMLIFTFYLAGISRIAVI